MHVQKAARDSNIVSKNGNVMHIESCPLRKHPAKNGRFKKTMALIAKQISERMHILKAPFNTYYKFFGEVFFWFIVLQHCFAQQQQQRWRRQ